MTIFAELPGAYTSNRYLRIGHFIGIAASIPTFLAGWAIAISTTGFFIGVCLGWLPGVILGAIAYFLFYYGWGPLLVAGAVAGLASLNQ